jgi:hypothetical protein
LEEELIRLEMARQKFRGRKKFRTLRGIDSNLVNYPKTKTYILKLPRIDE